MESSCENGNVSSDCVRGMCVWLMEQQLPVHGRGFFDFDSCSEVNL